MKNDVIRAVPNFLSDMLNSQIIAFCIYFVLHKINFIGIGVLHNPQHPLLKIVLTGTPAPPKGNQHLHLFQENCVLCVTTKVVVFFPFGINKVFLHSIE